MLHQFLTEEVSEGPTQVVGVAGWGYRDSTHLDLIK